MADAIFVGDLLRRLERAADQRDDLDAVDVPEAVEMLFAEGAGAGERDLHGWGSSTIWPTAVLLAGT